MEALKLKPELDKILGYINKVLQEHNVRNNTPNPCDWGCSTHSISARAEVDAKYLVEIRTMILETIEQAERGECNKCGIKLNSFDYIEDRICKKCMKDLAASAR